MFVVVSACVRVCVLALHFHAKRRFGEHSWAQVAKCIPGRVDSVCRRRWRAFPLDLFEEFRVEFEVCAWPRMSTAVSSGAVATDASTPAVPLRAMCAGGGRGG